MEGAGSSEVISQAEVELYIQPPTFETRVAAHMIAYVRCRNGLHIEAGGGWTATVIDDSHALVACPESPDGRLPPGAWHQ
jgi:hypothetical protein